MDSLYAFLQHRLEFSLIAFESVDAAFHLSHFAIEVDPYAHSREHGWN